MHSTRFWAPLSKDFQVYNGFNNFFIPKFEMRNLKIVFSKPEKTDEGHKFTQFEKYMSVEKTTFVDLYIYFDEKKTFAEVKNYFFMMSKSRSIK